MDQEAEIKRLKVKCNRQLDEINMLKETVKIREEEIESLHNNYSVKKGGKSEKVIDEKTDNFSDKNLVEQYARVLIRMIDRLQDGKLFINYKNTCKNSREFFRLKSEDFQGIAEEFIKIDDMSSFYKFCIRIGVVKSHGGSCIYNDVIQGKATKVIFIRKAAIEVVQNDT